MSAMSKPRCPLNGVARKLIPVYKAQHEQGADVSSFEWANLSEMLNCLGKQHQTKCENRVSANMNSRVASSLRVFLRREVAEETYSADMNEVSSHIIHQLSGAPVGDNLPWGNLKAAATPETITAAEGKIAALRTRYGGLLLNPSSNDRNVRNKSWLYLR